MKLGNIKSLLVQYINHFINVVYIIFLSCHGVTEYPVIPLNCIVSHSSKLFVQQHYVYFSFKYLTVKRYSRLLQFSNSPV